MLDFYVFTTHQVHRSKHIKPLCVQNYPLKPSHNPYPCATRSEVFPHNLPCKTPAVHANKQESRRRHYPVMASLIAHTRLPLIVFIHIRKGKTQPRHQRPSLASEKRPRNRMSEPLHDSVGVGVWAFPSAFSGVSLCFGVSLCRSPLSGATGFGVFSRLGWGMLPSSAP